MSIGADIQNTTYSDLRPAKAKGKKSKRRSMIKRALKGQDAKKPKKNSTRRY